jgi:hypothetical protein
MVETFNYEDIYEISRNEKFSSDLQELTKEDLRKIKEYFKEKGKGTQSQNQSTNLFATHNRAKVQIEISNASRVIKDLLERRERKLINRAVFNSRIENSIRDTSNMLEIEEELYDQLIFIIKRFRKGFTATIDNDGNYPSKIMQKLKIREDIDIKTHFKEGQKTAKKEFKEAIDKQVEKNKEESIDLEEYTITSDTPEFYGPNMNKYGPFITGDKVKLPREVIELLNAQKPSKITNEITFATPASNDTEGVINASEVIENNEIPKNSSNVLSGEGLQKASGTHNETDEKQTTSEDKEKRTE